MKLKSRFHLHIAQRQLTLVQLQPVPHILSTRMIRSPPARDAEPLLRMRIPSYSFVFHGGCGFTIAGACRPCDTELYAGAQSRYNSIDIGLRSLLSFREPRGSD